MCLSQTAGYAIHALGMIASGGGRLCLIREIADDSGIPRPYLAKIVNQLAREGLLSAKRGYRGGVFLTRPPQEITLLNVVEAIEGKDFIAECMLGLNECGSPCGCPTHKIWKRMREEIRQVLGQSTLADVLSAMHSRPQRGKSKRTVQAAVSLAAAKPAPAISKPPSAKNRRESVGLARGRGGGAVG